MDTVLFGGAGFFITTGICFFLIRAVDNSSITERNKRLINFLILGLLTIIIILIFKWHSDTYILSQI